MENKEKEAALINETNKLIKNFFPDDFKVTRLFMGEFTSFVDRCYLAGVEYNDTPRIRHIYLLMERMMKVYELPTKMWRIFYACFQHEYRKGKYDHDEEYQKKRLEETKEMLKKMPIVYYTKPNYYSWLQ